ncbi:general transcription factor IIH subunit 1-like [Dendronephthya gigantea]|uniref:general transcription factor IIH subunit 1-like n=1 Tax=Dendronephthya gigantea TaxID=151771 RepID=UPI00106CFD70|nr:general transcription factor IIH subunit 1-like [Dendronephthya gigantea]
MAGEEVLLISEHVRYKKNNGKLMLLSDKIMWTADGADKPRLCYVYSDIKVQRISPEGSSKMQLQTVLHDGNSYSFHFVNNAYPGAERRDRDDVKDLLAQLIPAHRKKANKDLEEKNKLLQNNPDLYQLYKDLVVGDIITAAEFWANRANEQTSSNETGSGDVQTIGLSSGFLSEVKPESSGCNELRYNLDADTIAAIFKTYPAVKKKHLENVPDQMSEKEFWTKFFQSHFFHRDRQKTSSDLFLECANKDEQEFLEQKLSNFYDRLLDISESSPLSDQGYGHKQQSSDSSDQKSKNDNLFRRFNHQSSMVLKSYADTPSQVVNEKSTNSKDEPPIKVARLRDMVRYEDLEEETTNESVVLKIKDKNQFCQGIAVETTQAPHKVNSYTNGTDNLTSYAERCSMDIRSWQPELVKTLSSDCACEVLTEFSPGGLFMRDTMSEINGHGLQTLQRELRQHYNAITELLRHFWSCFPVTSIFLEEKLERMTKCLEKYRDIKLRNFISTLENPTYGEHLMKMIDIAVTKYQTLQEKKTKVKLK